MKNLLFAFIICLFGFQLTAQESLIAGIMQVDPVNLTIGEEDQEKVDAYDASYTEELAELDELLTKQSEEYAEEITDLVTTFTSSMEKGDERTIRNEKQKVNTMANSKTFSLIKNKKTSIQNFHNAMKTGMRDLPRPIAKMKEKELNDLVEDYRNKIHEEFEANQRVLKAFKATEHIQKTHISDMPASSDTSEN